MFEVLLAFGKTFHMQTYFAVMLQMIRYIFNFTVARSMTFFVCAVQKVADDKGVKAKKGGAKGKKEDGPAQNGETKTNEVRGGETE